MIDWWGPIVDEYRVLEAIGSTLITADEWLAHPGSVGRAMTGTLHIVGEDGTGVARQAGREIYFEGGFDFEYLNDSEKTARPAARRGWKTVATSISRRGRVSVPDGPPPSHDHLRQ